MASQLCLVLGGVRSGKSAFAESKVASFSQSNDGSVLYVATGVAVDDEMKQRIERHKESRPQDWATLEEPTGLVARMAPLLSDGQDVGTVIIDSVDVWVANLLMQYVSDPKETIEKIVTDAADQLLVLMAVSPQAYVMVSSEVGLSLVPPEPLGRRFQDLLGLVNQRLAATATEVYLVVAGIPMQIKPYD